MQIKFIVFILRTSRCRSSCRWLWIGCQQYPRKQDQARGRLSDAELSSQIIFISVWFGTNAEVFKIASARKHTQFGTYMSVCSRRWLPGARWSPKRSPHSMVHQEAEGPGAWLVLDFNVCQVPRRTWCPRHHLGCSSGLSGSRESRWAWALWLVPALRFHNLSCLCPTIPSLSAWRLTVRLVPISSVQNVFSSNISEKDIFLGNFYSTYHCRSLNVEEKWLCQNSCSQSVFLALALLIHLAPFWHIAHVDPDP